MYSELDELLSEKTGIDSWYDDGVLVAQSMMNEFSNDDWDSGKIEPDFVDIYGYGEVAKL